MYILKLRQYARKQSKMQKLTKIELSTGKIVEISAEIYDLHRQLTDNFANQWTDNGDEDQLFDIEHALYAKLEPLEKALGLTADEYNEYNSDLIEYMLDTYMYA